MSIVADPRFNIVRVRAESALAWWLAELRSLWLDAVRGLRAAAGSALAIEAGERRWIVRRRGLVLGEIDWAGGDTVAGGSRLRELTAGSGRTPAITVEVPPERVLSKVIDLPPDAAGELDRILRFEIARHFPFTAERMVYRHRIVSRSPLKVDIVAVPRDIIGSIADGLAAAGLQPSEIALVAAGNAPPLCLPPEAMSPPPEPAMRRRLVAFAALLGLAAAVSWPIAQRVRLAGIEHEIAALKPAAEAALRAREEQRRAADREADIARLRGGRPPLIAVIDTLTRELPDGSWLSSLSIAGHDVLLEGLTPSAATIALTLGRNQSFASVVFRSPIARDAASGLEHFQLGATIEAPR